MRPAGSGPVRIREYTTFQCRVWKWSTIRVGGRIYSVPSRLIGHPVEARQHPATVAVHDAASAGLGGAPDRLPPHHRELGPEAGRAFARYRFREELFPSLTFRAAYDALGRTHGERADVEYVRLLHLAAMTGERLVEAALRARLDADVPCDYAGAQAQVRPPVPTVPGGPRAPPGSGAVRRVADRRSAPMTAPSTQVTTLLTQFGLTTAAEELVPRLTQAGTPRRCRCCSRCSRRKPRHDASAGSRGCAVPRGCRRQDVRDARHRQVAGAGRAATANAGHRGVPRDGDERAGVRPAGRGQEPCAVRRRARAGLS